MDQMTVFCFHPCARISVDWLHDKMLVNMQQETQQLIASAIQYRFCESDERLPVPRFLNHPWLSWAMESSDHMEWLFAYYLCCVEKLENVFNKEDRSWRFQVAVRDWIPLFPRAGWRSVPLSVPVDCINEDICTSYRTYYLRCKCKGGSYKRVRAPYWVREHYDRPSEPDSPVDSAEYPGIMDS